MPQKMFHLVLFAVFVRPGNHPTQIENKILLESGSLQAEFRYFPYEIIKKSSMNLKKEGKDNLIQKKTQMNWSLDTM